MPLSYGCLDCDRRFASVAAGCSHSKAKGHAFPACEGCNRVFINQIALIDHLKYSAAHWGTYCNECNRLFAAEGAYIQHMAHSPVHRGRYCKECNQAFVDEQAYKQHLKHSPAHRSTYCNECDRLFVAEGAYIQHMAQSPIHRGRYCEKCNQGFVDKQAYKQHVVFKHPRHYCRDCDRSFASKSGRDMHVAHSPLHKANRKKDHNPILTLHDTSEQNEPQCHYPSSTNSECPTRMPAPDRRCVVCPRNFSSSRALAKHNGSSVHRVRSFQCFFCAKLFKTPSAIAMHIESGCHRITRNQVTAAVHELNIIPQISIVHLLGDTAKPPTRIITYSASSLAFNGYGYECYLCHSTFKTLDRLNQHMSSPTHDGLEFRCPRCASEFQLISGLVQHLESGCCGIARLNQIAKQFESLTGQLSRLLAF